MGNDRIRGLLKNILSRSVPYSFNTVGPSVRKLKKRSFIQSFIIQKIATNSRNAVTNHSVEKKQLKTNVAAEYFKNRSEKTTSGVQKHILLSYFAAVS